MQRSTLLTSFASTTPSAQRNVLRVLALTLWLLGSAYTLKGTFYMFTSAPDLGMRWTEFQYVRRGTNPLDVWEQADALKHNRPLPTMARPREADVVAELGESPGGYPPWAYTVAALFAWPRFELARVLFGALNLVGFGFCLLWAYRIGRNTSAELGMTLAGAVFAVASICTTFGLGQYGVIVISALVGALVLDERKQHFLAGILLGVSLTKISLSAPFLVPFVLTRRIRSTAAAALYVAAGSLVVWVVTDTDPLTMLGQMVRCTQAFIASGYSLINGFASVGVSTHASSLLAAGSCVLLTTVVCWLWRDAPLLVHFAVAGTASRLWTYHQHYDNLIELFLLLALGMRARHNTSALAAFLLVGVGLWAPAQVCDMRFFQVYQLVVWPSATAVLLWITPRVASSAEVVVPEQSIDTRNLLKV